MRNKTYGVREAYNHYQKVRDNDKVATSKEYHAVVRETTQELIEELILNLKLPLPKGLGTLLIRKREYKPRYEDGKIKGLPLVDLRLSEQEGRKVRFDMDKCFYIKHSKRFMSIKGGFRITFRATKALKARVKSEVKKGNIIDTYI